MKTRVVVKFVDFRSFQSYYSQRRVHPCLLREARKLAHQRLLIVTTSSIRHHHTSIPHTVPSLQSAPSPSRAHPAPSCSSTSTRAYLQVSQVHPRSANARLTRLHLDSMCTHSADAGTYQARLATAQCPSQSAAACRRSWLSPGCLERARLVHARMWWVEWSS